MKNLTSSSFNFNPPKFNSNFFNFSFSINKFSTNYLGNSYKLRIYPKSTDKHSKFPILETPLLKLSIFYALNSSISDKLNSTSLSKLLLLLKYAFKCSSYSASILDDHSPRLNFSNLSNY